MRNLLIILAFLLTIPVFGQTEEPKPVVPWTFTLKIGNANSNSFTNLNYVGSSGPVTDTVQSKQLYMWPNGTYQIIETLSHMNVAKITVYQRVQSIGTWKIDDSGMCKRTSTQCLNYLNVMIPVTKPAVNTMRPINKCNITGFSDSQYDNNYWLKN